MERDLAWRRFFDRLPVLESINRDGFFRLSADELKAHGGREPRLMAKIDTLAERPTVLAENKLALFPVKNGHYILFPDPDQKSFFRFSNEDDAPIRNFRSAVDLNNYDTLPRGRESSESQALDFAYISGLLAHFCGEKSMQLTLRGRFFSGKFSFESPLNAISIDVDRVQIEIDAGYEGESGIYLLEAKRGRREDFHIRQLWYPWLHWSSRTCKRVMPIFFTYSNGQYFFSEMAFGEKFGDAHIVRSRAYYLDESPMLELDFHHLMDQVKVGLEPEGTFPQANDLDKLVDLVLLEEESSLTKFEIAGLFNFDERQGDYYGNAGCYLGLMKRGSAGFELTADGRQLSRIKSRAKRTEQLISMMLKIPSFRAAILLLIERSFRIEKIGNVELVQIILDHTALSSSTPNRRASTLRAWLNWIMKNIRLRNL